MFPSKTKTYPRATRERDHEALLSFDPKNKFSSLVWSKADKDLREVFFFFSSFGLVLVFGVVFHSCFGVGLTNMAIQAQLYSDNLGFPLCGSQDWMMDNSCGGGVGVDVGGLFFSLQSKQLQQQHDVQQLQYQQQRHQNQFSDNSFLASTLKTNSTNTTNTTNTNNSHLSMVYSQSIACQFEKQRQETDQYLRLQNERLRLVLQEQRKQQLATLLKKIESRTLLLLRQKDEEIARAASRTLELEDFVRKLEAENQAWQRVAQENEAMVVSLNNTLEQVIERTSCGFNSVAEDAESCCDFNEENIEEEGQGETEENRGGYEIGQRNKKRKRNMMMMVCKGCNSRNSCMMFLPCRHLCSCKACEAFLDACPVCSSTKKASIEALIF